MPWDLFCMPGHFGERHALQAWGTCDPKSDEYTIGDSTKPIPQVSLHNDLTCS